MHINELHTVREGVREWEGKKGQLYDDSFAPPPHAFFYFIILHSAALCTVICWIFIFLIPKNLWIMKYAYNCLPLGLSGANEKSVQRKQT